jgi:hypothetical protein
MPGGGGGGSLSVTALSRQGSQAQFASWSSIGIKESHADRLSISRCSGYPFLIFHVAYWLAMAEVLGIVASGIAVSQLFVGITEATRKLHGAWSQFQNAPHDIKHILEELDILGQSLVLLEKGIEHELRLGKAPGIQKSIQLCQKAAGDLDDLVSMFPPPDASGTSSSQSAAKLKMKWKVLCRSDQISLVRERLHRVVRIPELCSNMLLTVGQRFIYSLHITPTLISDRPADMFVM